MVMPKNKVLVPLNQSELSRQILPHIEKFISAQKNELLLFYITKPVRGIGFAAPDPDSNYQLQPGGEPLGPEPHPIYAPQQEESIKATVEVELLPVKNRLLNSGYDVSVMINFGDNPLEEVVRAVKNDNIALIAMSIQARVGLTRFFFKDLANQIAQETNIPMLLIHSETSQ